MMDRLNSLVGLLKKIIFNYRSPLCVGVDISSSALKMVELQPGTLTIVKYSLYPLADQLVHNGLINDLEQLALSITEQWQHLQSKLRAVAIALPSHAVIIKELSAPGHYNSSELDHYVLEHILREFDDIEFEFDYIVNSYNDTQQNLKLIVAKKAQLEEYQALLQMSGLKLAAIEVEVLALQYLFARILNHTQLTQQVLIIELGANRIRSFIYSRSVVDTSKHQDYQWILLSFNELAVNYQTYLEQIILNAMPGMQLYEIKHLSAYVWELILKENSLASDLCHEIIRNIGQLMEQSRLSLMQENNLELAEDMLVYLSGGNCFIPGVLPNLQTIYKNRVYFIADLLGQDNPHIPREQLNRLITAMALATWGHN